MQTGERTCFKGCLFLIERYLAGQPVTDPTEYSSVVASTSAMVGMQARPLMSKPRNSTPAVKNSEPRPESELTMMAKESAKIQP